MEPVRAEAGDPRPPCHRPFAYAAWGLFVVSFFLPTYAENQDHVRGWRCAWRSITLPWSGLGLFPGPMDTADLLLVIHFMMLTLANVFMLTSPFFLLRRVCGRWTNRCLLFGAFISLVLTSSFLCTLQLQVNSSIPGISGIRIGYFVWVMSFAVLGVSIMRGGINPKG